MEREKIHFFPVGCVENVCGLFSGWMCVSIHLTIVLHNILYYQYSLLYVFDTIDYGEIIAYVRHLLDFEGKCSSQFKIIFSKLRVVIKAIFNPNRYWKYCRLQVL